VKEGYFIFNGVKSWPLVQLRRISTVGSKCVSQVVKSAGKWLVGLDTLGRRLSRRGVNQPEQTIPGCKAMLGDHLRASFVKFDGG
jgi:hypothetical protein